MTILSIKDRASTGNRRRRHLLLASAIAGAASMTSAAFAEEAEPLGAEGEADDAIVVSGIRGALNEASQIKRKADSVVDVISAEDVGKFPDVNIAEAMQRITGVQINRTRGEGRTVNIRGLPANFTQTLLNGRTLPNAIGSAAGSRTFDFTILAPEFIRTLSVHKSPTADLMDGGLSGTVNIETPRPLDIGKRVLSGSAQAEYETNSGKAAPRLAAFYSDVFADGRVGVSLGLSYTRRKPETHFAGTWYSAVTEGAGIPTGGVAGAGDDLNGDGVITPSQLVRIPNNQYFYNFEEDNERYAAIGSLQFKPSDTLTFSFDGLYSKLNVDAQSNESLNLFTGATRVISAETQNIEGVPTTTRFRVADLDSRGSNRFEHRSGYVYSLAGGARYQTDQWDANVELSYAKSSQHRDNLNIATISNGEAEFSAKPGDRIGSLAYLGTYAQGHLDPNTYRIASLNGEFNQISTDKVWDARADVRRNLGDSGLRAVQFGARFTRRTIDRDNRRLTVGAAGVSSLYGGLPAGPIAGSVSAAPLMTIREVGKGSFLGSYNGSAVFPTSWLASDTRGFVERFTDAQLIAAGTLTNDASGIVDVTEQTLAGYARTDLSFGKLDGNIGLRVVRTQQETNGVSPDLSGITVLPEAGGITRVPSAGALSIKRSYTDFLPTLNLRFAASETLQFRFSAARTVTRPNLADISPTTTASGTALTVTRNNPFLDPFRANNVDVTAEWYFSRDGLIGGALFYKDLKSLIRREQSVQALPVTYIRSDGSQQSSTLNFTVSQLVNGSGVTLKGLELYYQQAFRSLPAPFDGLGTVLNYTYIENSDPTQLTAASKHNFNATAYYEKGPIGVRLSYSWRSAYLSVPGQAPVLSEYVRPFGTLDGSINLRLKNGVTFVVEAVNILDTDETSRYNGDLPASYTDAGRRIFAGVRFSL